MFNVVLYEPEIPQNTGNIARLCAATGCRLHLVGPLGFSLQDRYLKRAGLDYWHLVEVIYYDSFEEVRTKYPDARFFYLSTKGKKHYDSFSYREGDFFANFDFCLRIPMVNGARSLNLANSVAIVVYEAFRQQKFRGLS